MKLWYVTIFILLFSIVLIYACPAPSPDELAINSLTRECGIYTEQYTCSFEHVPLPSGWEIQNNYTITVQNEENVDITLLGICFKYPSEINKECMSNFGFRYDEYSNFVKDKPDISALQCNFLYNDAVLVDPISKKYTYSVCTLLLNRSENNISGTLIWDNSPAKFESGKRYQFVYFTNVGSCNASTPGSIRNYSACCEQLNLTFKPGYIGYPEFESAHSLKLKIIFWTFGTVFIILPLLIGLIFLILWILKKKRNAPRI